jgi:cell division protein ZapA
MPDLSNTAQVVKVNIFGEEYSIRGTDDPEYIQSVADYLNKTMRVIASKNKNMPPIRIAVLAALNLAGELFDEKKNKDADLSEMKNRAENILGMLDERLSID